MKVKFYKGPYHNKTREVPDYMYEVVVTGMTNARLTARDFMNADPYAPVPITKHMYIRTNHTHPDGSVFFAYKGKQ